MFALAFAGIPPPVTNDGGGGASDSKKKTQTRTKGDAGDANVAKLLMMNEPLLAGGPFMCFSTTTLILTSMALIYLTYCCCSAS
jgi:hypothetical protein